MKGSLKVASLLQRWSVLHRLHHEFATHLERAVTRHLGLSYREFWALTLLEEYSCAPTAHRWLREVAEGIGLTQSATSRLIRRLEDRGLVVTAACVEDKRSVLTELTPAAQGMLRQARPRVEEAAVSALMSLASTDLGNCIPFRFLEGVLDEGVAE
jgi:DNA-binding MarR family transcriptional regulator